MANGRVSGHTLSTCAARSSGTNRRSIWPTVSWRKRAAWVEALQHTGDSLRTPIIALVLATACAGHNQAKRPDPRTGALPSNLDSEPAIAIEHATVIDVQTGERKGDQTTLIAGKPHRWRGLRHLVRRPRPRATRGRHWVVRYPRSLGDARAHVSVAGSGRCAASRQRSHRDPGHGIANRGTAGARAAGFDPRRESTGPAHGRRRRPSSSFACRRAFERRADHGEERARRRRLAGLNGRRFHQAGVPLRSGLSGRNRFCASEWSSRGRPPTLAAGHSCRLGCRGTQLSSTCGAFSRRAPRGRRSSEQPSPGGRRARMGSNRPGPKGTSHPS